MGDGDILNKIAGLTLKEAKSILEEAGMVIHGISVTSPPRDRHNEHQDYYRVIRIDSIDFNKVHLLVCKPL